MAEKWIAEAEKQNAVKEKGKKKFSTFIQAVFLQMLCMELANNDKPAQTRKLAGLIIKNSLGGKVQNLLFRGFDSLSKGREQEAAEREQVGSADRRQHKESN